MPAGLGVDPAGRDLEGLGDLARQEEAVIGGRAGHDQEGAEPAASGMPALAGNRDSITMKLGRQRWVIASADAPDGPADEARPVALPH